MNVFGRMCIPVSHSWLKLSTGFSQAGQMQVSRAIVQQVCTDRAVSMADAAIRFRLFQSKTATATFAFFGNGALH
jgi:hypothetical protein